MGAPNTTTDASLYRRIGGYDVIAAVIDDLFARMRADSRFERFGAGRSLDSRRRAQQLTVDQICSVSGGPCYYTGRDMRTSHSGLGISESEWAAFLEITRKTLENHSIGPREQSEFLELFTRYKNDIVETA
jgi:hemoglobin